MRLDPVQGRRGATLALVLLGCLAVSLSGGLPAAVGLATALATGLGRVRARSPRAETLGTWRIANGVALGLAVMAGVGGAPLLVVGASLVGWLLVHRSWTGGRAADDRVSLLLALLLLLLGCILTLSIALAPLFVAFAFLSPAALALSFLGGEREEGTRGRGGAPLGALLALGLVAVGLTALFFFGIPRMQRPGGFFASEDQVTVAGFGDEVVVGDGGAPADNPAVVLRVRLDGDAGVGPWYMRGAALDTFDGARWSRQIRDEVVFRGDRAPPPGALRQEILQEPMPETVLFGVPELVAVSGIDGPIMRDAGRALRLGGPPRRLEYTSYSAPPNRDPDRLRLAVNGSAVSVSDAAEALATRRRAWTQLPDSLDPAIRTLAGAVIKDGAAGPGPWEAALALESWLRRDFEYTDQAEPELDGQSLSDFLMRNRRGHCEYFAAGLAVMLRSQGIPARVVTGFLGGEWNSLGGYLVFRQSDAHAWVEVRLGDEGWVQLDGTPAGSALPGRTSALGAAADWARERWLRLVLNYDLGDQLGFLRSALPAASGGGGGAGLGTAGGLVLGLVALVLGVRAGMDLLAGERARRARPRERVAQLHAAGRKLVARRGWEPPGALPPVSAAEWLVSQAGDPARPMLELAWILYRCRYGGEPDAALTDAAREALRALDALPHRSSH